MSDLLCLPAIDIREGKCVRLLQGDFANETVYGDPIDQAHRYVSEGATFLHVVDLDAARNANTQNRQLITRIITEVEIDIEIGGGIRDSAAASVYLDAGARRVIVGTAAIEHPEVVLELSSRYPGRVGVGLDHRIVEAPNGARREVALRGWEVGSGLGLDEAIGQFANVALDAVIVTDISRDGMLCGPDIEGYAHLLGVSSLPIVASGGIKGPEDLRALADLTVDGRVLSGVVVGKALLSGAMTLKEALAACAR